MYWNERTGEIRKLKSKNFVPSYRTLALGEDRAVAEGKLGSWCVCMCVSVCVQAHTHFKQGILVWIKHKYS